MRQSQLDLGLSEIECQSPPGATALPTGFSALDLHLPDNGWPSSTITEIFYDGAATTALQLILPTLAQVSRHNRWLAWIAPPSLPYRAQFRAAGIDPERALVIRPHPHNNGLWAVEQALRSGTCATVLSWVTEADHESIEQLKDAARIGGSCGLLFRPIKALIESKASHLRLHIRNNGRNFIIRVLNPQLTNNVELRIQNGSSNKMK
ncbi:MAG: hypothetical protein HY272_12225 [Gammaproteobacteria bacterium]|nr:hypothetical protein [Gammaproteobacteria bacterium]